MVTKQIESNGLEITKSRTGLKRSAIQIKATIIFEWRRNLKNLIIMLCVATAIYVLTLVINLIQEYRTGESPEDLVDYIKSFLFMIDFLILIIAAAFGGSIIAEDYHSQTGNLVFPKITKARLLTGRVIARYLYSALTVIFFYLLVIITTLIKYGSVSELVWVSMVWSLLYTFLVLSFVVFFSSFMKSTSATLITSILFILMVFNLANMILMFTGVEIEPFFILTYYASIITQSFAMPTTRFAEFSMGFNGGHGPTFMSWITPSIEGAIIGMLIYSALLLIAAYFFFRRRQQKQ